MEVRYDINSEYWRSVYRNLFDTYGLLHGVNVTRSQLEKLLLEYEGIEIVTDYDGRWIAVILASYDDAVKLALAYGE